MQPDTDHAPSPTPPRKPREPVFNVPGVILALVAVLVAIHAVMEAIGYRSAFDVVLDWGFVPATWTLRLDDGAVDSIIQRALDGDPASVRRSLDTARFVLAESDGGFWTALTYAFLHGSWMHVGLNCVWLLAFGSPVARRIGTERFLFLVGITAICGALLHWATNPYDVTPVIGASATVSGMMAASVRFVFSPRLFPGMPAHLSPRLGLVEMLGNRTAMLFIGIWFSINLLFGLAAVPLGLVSDGGIAWEAHIGGFVAGLFLFPLFDPAPRRHA